MRGKKSFKNIYKHTFERNHYFIIVTILVRRQGRLRSTVKHVPASHVVIKVDSTGTRKKLLISPHPKQKSYGRDGFIKEIQKMCSFRI